MQTKRRSVWCVCVCVSTKWQTSLKFVVRWTGTGMWSTFDKIQARTYERALQKTDTKQFVSSKISMTQRNRCSVATRQRERQRQRQRKHQQKVWNTFYLTLSTEQYVLRCFKCGDGGEHTMCFPPYTIPTSMIFVCCCQRDVECK